MIRVVMRTAPRTFNDRFAVNKLSQAACTTHFSAAAGERDGGGRCRSKAIKVMWGGDLVAVPEDLNRQTRNSIQTHSNGSQKCRTAAGNPDEASHRVKINRVGGKK